MATTQEFNDFVLDTLHFVVMNTSDLNYLHFGSRKMFGEYCVYVYDGMQTKVLFLLCDNTVFLKVYQELENLLSCTLKAPPFKGAKPYYVLDIESILLEEILRIVVPLIEPVKRKKVKYRIS